MADTHRILAVIESLGRGGAERHLVDVAAALRRRGHEMRVTALWGPYPLSTDLERHGVVVDRLDLSHRWRLDQGVRRLSGTVQRFAPTVIHSQLFFANLYSALVCLRSGPPVVTTLQNTDYVTYPTTTAWLRARKRVDAWVVRSRMDARIAVSSAVARHHDEELDLRGDIEVIPNSVNVAHLRTMLGDPADVRRRFGMNGNGALLLCPARLAPQKGHMVLLAAVAALRDVDQRFRVLLAGDGPCRSEIEEGIVSFGLEGTVQILGSQPHSEVIALMGAADAIVMPSFAEGLPVAVLEAHALGTPVVATTAGGTEEIIEHERTGLIVNPHDADALAAAIRRVLEDPATARPRAAAGMESAAARFDAEVVAARYEAVYDRLAAGHDGGNHRSVR